MAAVPAQTGQAQTYFWRDRQGREHESRDFRKVPPRAWATMRCKVRVKKALSGESLEVEGGHRLRLLGLDAPAGDLSWDAGLAAQAASRLQELTKDRVITCTFSSNFKNAAWETLVHARLPDGRSVNEIMLQEGLAALLLTGADRAQAQKLKAAAMRARKARRGLWKTWKKESPSGLKPVRGFSLGLYSRDPHFDYTPLLKEQVAIGATDVMLITPWFLENHKACRMVPKKHRTTPLEQVARTVRQARSLGFRVTLMPIVLLWQADDDHWRGNIAPEDLEDWFLAYQEFIGAFASLAQESGAENLLVGSEFSSLEKEEQHWREVIAGVRQRYQGRLSYSANWDHLDVIRWWDALDAIGMTAYHTLTDKDDPTVAELTAAWKRIRKNLEGILASYDLPYFFSEMGYASLDGINRNPWDYVSPDRVDEDEQADCYEAWFSAWRNPQRRFRGAFFYTWWRNNDKDDERQYTVHGKKAEGVIRRWFAEGKSH